MIMKRKTMMNQRLPRIQTHLCNREQPGANEKKKYNYISGVEIIDGTGSDGKWKNTTNRLLHCFPAL
jgi:hypothetical protein